MKRLEGKFTLEEINRRIDDLRNEKLQIEDIYKKLVKFLHAHAILPLNDDIIEYLKHFIREEQMKRNQTVVQGLEKTMENYRQEIQMFKETLANLQDTSSVKSILKPEEIFPLVETLYRLPINGAKIREQVHGLRITQGNMCADREVFIQLPEKAQESKIMSEFQFAFNSK